MNIVKWKNIVFIFLCLMSVSVFAEVDYLVCIDGGGSRTILQLFDAQGRLIPLTKNNVKYEKIETTGSNINIVGREGVKAVFHSLFDNIQIEDGVSLIDILPQSQIVAGLSGAALPQAKQSIITLFEEYPVKKEQVLLLGDAELALQLIDNQGIVLISGTGSICFGKKNGELYRVGGLGRILGDEGSGYQIGLQALKAALAEEYGWGSATSLTTTLKEFFNVTELKTLIPKVNLGEILPSKIASSTPLVFKEAERGDRVAKEIIDSAASDLADLLIAQLKNSTLSDCEVHLWGGVFKNSYKEEFIQKIMGKVDSANKFRLKVVNKSEENSAADYVCKFNLFKEKTDSNEISN